MPPGWQPNTPLLAGGVPWEQPGGGFFSRWWSTIAGIFKGRPFFAAAAQSEDAMSAVTFNCFTMSLVGCVVGLVNLVTIALLGAAFLGTFGGTRWITGMAGGLVTAGVLQWLMTTIVFAVGGFVGPWIMGGIHHLILAMFGGLPQDKNYSHTVRAHAYANGGALIFMAIPIPYLGMYLGGMAAFAFGIKNHMEAYDEMHHCGSGKALLAYFTPYICSCCGGWALVAMIGGLLGAIR